MKKIYVLSLALLLSITFAGCVKEKDSESTGISSLQTSNVSMASSKDISVVSSKSASGAATQSKTSSSANGDNQELLSQLKDLENVLSSLDQLSDGDLEIPTP